ncbi:unnamed protein product, partial [Polarella glacialis]
ANPDVWRDGGRNNTSSSSKTGGRIIGQNMLLKNKGGFSVGKANPYSSKCKHCKCALHQQGEYCSQCAYTRGLCAMCGKAIVDVSMHLMSTT